MDDIQLIESGLVCDNTECNWTDKTILQKDYINWVNKPCPNCGENLLTQEDYTNSLKMMSMVEFVNSLDDEALEEYNSMVSDLSEEEKTALLSFMGDTKMEDLDTILDRNITDEEIINTYSLKVKCHNGIKIEGLKPIDNETDI